MNPEGGEINPDKTLTLSRTNNPLVEKKITAPCSSCGVMRDGCDDAVVLADDKGEKKKKLLEHFTYL